MTPRTKASPPRCSLTGNDQLCAILLRTLYSARMEVDARQFLAYRDRARQILASTHAFDLGRDTLNVTDSVLRGDSMRTGADEDRSYARLLDVAIDGEGPERVEATADDLQSMLFKAIDEAQLLGAALMFELLRGEGGAR